MSRSFPSAWTIFLEGPIHDKGSGTTTVAALLLQGQRHEVHHLRRCGALLFPPVVLNATVAQKSLLPFVFADFQRGRRLPYPHLHLHAGPDDKQRQTWPTGAPNCNGTLANGKCPAFPTFGVTTTPFSLFSRSAYLGTLPATKKLIAGCCIRYACNKRSQKQASSCRSQDVANIPLAPSKRFKRSCSTFNATNYE